MSQQLKASHRRILTIIVESLITVNVSLAGLAATNSIVISPFVFLGLGIAALVAHIIKNEYQISDDKVAYKGEP